MMERLKGNGHTHVFLNTRRRAVDDERGAVAGGSGFGSKLGLADDLCAYLCPARVRHAGDPERRVNGRRWWPN